MDTPEVFRPHIQRSHTAWAAFIKAEKIRLFKSKLSGYVASNDHDISSKACPIASNDVKIVSSDYLLKSYKAEWSEHNDIVDSIIADFTLNPEQERAFRIIANHASSLAPSQLRMYLGGMGGTGKSQVIKSLIRMFEARGEAHRFIVLAPTGTAAALLNGSTYHSALGIFSRSDRGQDFTKNETTIINDVRTRLNGVQYIFIDEVLMLSSRDLYAISRRLSQVFNDDTMFGSISMILAGDFAQLPPVGNLPFYSPSIKHTQDARMKVSEQEATLGKIFWHQFTTVVILKQNMRQKTQSADDEKLRTALENMRYGACTAADVSFIRSRSANILLSEDGKPLLTDPEFRKVSVITAWNNQKDRFNEQGAVRFAEDAGRTLHHFYSIDSLGIQEGEVRRRRGRPSGSTKTDKPNKMNLRLQEALWNRSPCSSEQIPAKLSLCVGMPVMIRHNDATELCITKGQEGVVAGWDSSQGVFGRAVLDTLFVKLVNPPKKVIIDGLPENVVPLTHTSSRVTCALKSGAKVNVQRQQVLVLPNFAMTDYSSQGKTRDRNLVHLEHCKDHSSYYTSLSRSSNAEGTVLLGNLDVSKITKGISGHLRQEFRELNILDDITRLNYLGLLPDSVLHGLRNPTIRSFVLLNEHPSVGSVGRGELQLQL